MIVINNSFNSENIDYIYNILFDIYKKNDTSSKNIKVFKNNGDGFNSNSGITTYDIDINYVNSIKFNYNNYFFIIIDMVNFNKEINKLRFDSYNDEELLITDGIFISYYDLSNFNNGEYFFINGLFGNKNYKIELEDYRFKILISENGVGKSTILKILNAFELSKSLELVKYDFESLKKIIIKEKKITLYKETKYCDLIPPIEKNIILYNLYKKNQYKDYYNFIRRVMSEEEYSKIIMYYLIRESNKSNYDFEQFYVNSQLESLREYIKLYTNNYKFNVFLAIDKDLKIESHYIDCTINREYIDNLSSNIKKIQCYDDFIKINIDKDITDLFDKNVKIEEYEIEVNKLYEEFDALKEKIINNSEELYSFDDKDYETIIKKYHNLYKFANYCDISYKSLYFNDIETFYEDYSIIESIDPLEYDLPSLDVLEIEQKQYVFSYDAYINKKLNNNELISEQNELYSILNKMNEIVNKLENFKEDVSELYETIDVFKQVLYVDTYYINHIFDLEDLSNKNDDIYNNYSDLLSKIKESNVIDFSMIYDSSNWKNKATRNKRVYYLIQLLNSYFINKNVQLKGDDLVIRANDTNRRIDINSLSSGEKNLIFLFILTIVLNIEYIYLDEPEISMSISWQKRLLKDIEKFSTSKLIIASHSPFIVDNESFIYMISYIGDLEYD